MWKEAFVADLQIFFIFLRFYQPPLSDSDVFQVVRPA